MNMLRDRARKWGRTQLRWERTKNCGFDIPSTGAFEGAPVEDLCVAQASGAEAFSLSD